MMVLITGATGTVGRAILPYLIDAGANVRALTRRPETADLPPAVETVSGDLDRPHEWAGAMTGVDVFFLIAAGENTAEVMELAKASSVGRVVTLSSASAAFDDSPGGQFHRDVERTVEISGLPWTHLRPGMFAANLLDWAETIRRHRRVRAPYNAARQAPVHEKDVAAVAAATILDNSHNGSIYTLSGPQSLTKSEQIDAISIAIGGTVRFEEITPHDWRLENASYMPDYVQDWLLSYWENALDTPEPVYPDVENILGRSATSLVEWARDHRGEFR